MIQAAGAAFMMGFVAVLASRIRPRDDEVHAHVHGRSCMRCDRGHDLDGYENLCGSSRFRKPVSNVPVHSSRCFRVCGQPLSFSPFVCRICSSPIEMMAST